MNPPGTTPGSGQSGGGGQQSGGGRPADWVFPRPVAGWLLPGSTESAEALNQFEERIATLNANDSDCSASSGCLFNVNDRDWSSSVPDFRFWGHWNHSSLSGNIPLAQRIVFEIDPDPNGDVLSPAIPGVPPRYSKSLERKNVVGLMDHGYFGIEQHVHGISGDAVSTRAFSVSDDTIKDSLPLSTLNLVGASWTGDAMAIEKVTSSQMGQPEFGTASLEITNDVFRYGEFYGYVVEFDLALNNGYSFHLPVNSYDQVMRADEQGSEGFGVSERHPDGWYSFGGRFAGPLADEAIGQFETPQYVGAFGLDRQDR